MSLKFDLNWLKEKGLMFDDGACDEGIEVIKKLGFEGKEIDANELISTWNESTDVPNRLKRYANRYRYSKHALETFMYKKYGNLDNIVYANQFKISNGFQEKTCKTNATLNKYKEELISEVYDKHNHQVSIFFLLPNGAIRKTTLQEISKMSLDLKVIINSDVGHSYEVLKEEAKDTYERVVQLVRNHIESTSVTKQRVITDSEGFFEVWVEYTI